RIGFINPAVAPYQIRWYNPWNPDLFELDQPSTPTPGVNLTINVPSFPTTQAIWADGADAVGDGMSSGENDSLTIDEETGNGE
ncbi:MAG: hypothetical protein ACYS8K_09720, partial [Planctomycetota bacterium]